MSHDGIASAHDSGVVPPLIEHTHINTQVVGQIDSAVHGALIRADNHEMILIDRQIRIVAQKCLYKLVGRHEIVKTVKRNRILYARVMSVEGYDVADSHGGQLFQSHGAVE